MGLVARVIEEAGVTTAVHSWIPELSVGVGAPRVIGIGFPGSVPFGRPGDAAGQLAVLRGSLEVAARIETPGARVDLDFDWPAEARVPKPSEAPPIAQLLRRRPWLYPRLRSGDIPR